MRIRPCCAAVLLLALTLGLSPLRAMGQDAASIVGSWEGELSANGGQVTVVFHLERGERGDITGTFDSPDQGATGIPLASATMDDGTLTLVISGVQGSPTFTATLSEDGSVLSGTFTQLSFRLPLELTKRE